MYNRKELEKLAQKSPHCYQIGTNNNWQSPPGVDYAQQFGFDFQIWSNAKINWTLQRNLEFSCSIRFSNSSTV